jgi:DNA-binding LacI/PurR family transcriptional regulator
VSIIGIDDHELADFFGLSTIAQFPQVQGRRAVEILLDELHPGVHDHDGLNTPMPFELIARSSTAPPAA